MKLAGRLLRQMTLRLRECKRGKSMSSFDQDEYEMVVGQMNWMGMYVKVL